MLLVSSVGCLKIEVACLFRTVSIPDDLAICVELHNFSSFQTEIMS
jgi:hypothetical protein